MDGIVFHPCPFWNPGVAGTFPSLVEKYERAFGATISLQINTGAVPFCKPRANAGWEKGTTTGPVGGGGGDQQGSGNAPADFPSDALEQASRPLI